MSKNINDINVEILRDAISSGKIDPNQKYQIDTGDGRIMDCTGAEMIETAKACIAIVDAEKSGDTTALIAAAKQFFGI